MARKNKTMTDEGFLVSYDPLQRYLFEIRRFPFLTREEEFRLAVRAREGDLEAATRLILSNLQIVVIIARQYQRTKMNLMDLVQEGNIGLMQAVKKYDPSRKVALSTYASWWVRAYILRYIINSWRLVKIGTTQTQRRLFFHLMKEKEKLEAQGFEAGPKLLAERTQATEKEVVEMQQRLGNWEVSLDAPLTDESATNLGDILPSHDVGVDEKLATQEIKDLFAQHLSEFSKTLKGRELDILKKRILSESPLSLEEMGKKYRISKERVRQIEERIITRLRDAVKKKMKDFDHIAP